MSRGSKISLSSISFSVASVAGGTSLTGTVHLTGAAPKNGATVTLAINDPHDPCVVPASVHVPAGAASANFTIQTKTVASNFTEAIWGNYNVTKHASFTITAGVPVPACATPTFSPAGGSYVSAESVSLACATAG